MSRENGWCPEAATGQFTLPPADNEPVKDYAPGSPERAAIATELARMSSTVADMPMIIAGKEVRTGRTGRAVMPHRHAHILGTAHLGGGDETRMAIEAAVRTSAEWSRISWPERAAIFLKAADLLAGPWRNVLNAATMLGQSKTVQQAEIDSAAELIDFLRFNVAYMQRIYQEQPKSPRGVWNRVDYRPLEGFVFAITPFNFTAIAGNLPSAPALMGNCVVWKPAGTAMLSAHYIMKLLQAAGLPDGVINLVYGAGSEIGHTILTHPALAGIHFTGSTSVFNAIQRTVGERLDTYHTYPRIVGETGGKNFILAHASADLEALVTAIIRGAFEYQGQKCSAASRIVVPQSLWPAVRERVSDEINAIRVGDVADFKNFMGAVIDAKAWEQHATAIEEAKSGRGGTLVAGGTYDQSEGYFIHPTLLQATDMASRFMTEELFGPITTAFVYPDERFDALLTEIDAHSRYALTGAIFATDRRAVALASDRLRNAAGNFYVNDKPTGAVVGQQPFGGARSSGTNDKAGSLWNLMRWTSPRAIKEAFVPPTDWRYPFMG
jgi:1-pyrroline-5-carboxylate dehydrogenase